MAKKETVNYTDILENDIKFEYIKPKSSNDKVGDLIAVRMIIGNETYEIPPYIKVPCQTAFDIKEPQDPKYRNYKLQFSQKTSPHLFAVVEKINKALIPEVTEHVKNGDIVLLNKVYKSDPMIHADKIKKTYGDNCKVVEKRGTLKKEPTFDIEPASTKKKGADGKPVIDSFKWKLFNKSKRYRDPNTGKVVYPPLLNNENKEITPANYYNNSIFVHGTKFDPATIFFYVTDSQYGITIIWKLMNGMVTPGTPGSGASPDDILEGYEDDDDDTIPVGPVKPNQPVIIDPKSDEVKKAEENLTTGPPELNKTDECNDSDEEENKTAINKVKNNVRAMVNANKGTKINKKTAKGKGKAAKEVEDDEDE